MGGGNLFNALLHIRVPGDLVEEDLRADLERLSTLLMVDISLKEETVSASAK
jgi:hypothetical protein